MKITRIEPISEKQLLEKFQQTRLRGYGQALVYEQAQLSLVRDVDPNTLFPAQNYVLREDYQRLCDFYGLFKAQGYDIFSLEGGLNFWIQEEGEDQEEGPIPLTPPVVEISLEPDGRTIPLINDGMHRVYTAKQWKRSLHIILVQNVPNQWPYYAYAREKGWEGVEELAELPDQYVKKSYRDPDNYKSLFRDFNAILPGIQKQRKPCNPNRGIPGK